MTKEICDLFSMESLSGSPSTEHSTLVHIFLERDYIQGLQAKPRKAERLDFIISSVSGQTATIFQTLFV